VVLDNWKYVRFAIDDKTASLSMKDLAKEYMEPAAVALRDAIETALFGLTVNVGQYVGTAGDPPDSVADFAEVKKVMDECLIPSEPRYCVLSPAAELDYHSVFYASDTLGDAGRELMTGELGKKFGIQFFGSTEVPSQLVSSNDGAGAIDNGAGYTAGVTTIHVDGLGNNKTVLAGSPIKIGSYYYVVTTNATSSADAEGECDLLISPALKAAVVDDAVVTVIAGAHVRNIAFNPGAFALVSRPLAEPKAPGANVAVIQYDGIGIRSSIWYEAKDKKTYVDLDLLFGVKTLDPNKAVRVLG
ncbi:hypothetical protein EG835_15355, partial [bacterium]|nr:hypothetical protein [bacterium]